MGPYCKFCNDRCFIPTEKNDYVKTDLKATCKEGIMFDMDKTYKKLLNKDDSKQVGWILSRNNGENYTLVAEIIQGKVMEYEIASWDIEEIIDLTKKPEENNWFRLK